MKAPSRLLFSAAASSTGKTTLALLTLIWAKKSGLRCAAFKCGPDFIDRQYLEWAGASPAFNLDAWMAGPVAQSFAAGAEGADLAVIEGAMGLYDGKRGERFGRYSAAECAASLRCPVIVVLNAKKSGVTLATQVLGLQQAGRQMGIKVPIAGVVLNDVSGKAAYDLIAPAIRELCRIPVFGWLPRLKALEMPERHLGLRAAGENLAWLESFGAGLAEAEKTVDFKALLRCAALAPRLHLEELRPASDRRGPKLRIAMALDQAFHFYYPDNLNALRQAGAELVPFSPLKDPALPEGVQGLLLGGGFPELFGSTLQGNVPLRRELRARVRAGLCTWAECGGLMYLCSSLRDLDGKRWKMAGVLKAEVRMTRRLKNFGYTRILARRENVVLAKGQSLRGHEFHHSEILWPNQPSTAWELSQQGRGPARQEGYLLPRGLATYAHAHFALKPGVARRFVEACRKGSG